MRTLCVALWLRQEPGLDRRDARRAPVNLCPAAADAGLRPHWEVGKYLCGMMPRMGRGTVMRVIHLISGGDVGGAKTHVLSLLQGLSQARIGCGWSAFWRGRLPGRRGNSGIATASAGARSCEHSRGGIILAAGGARRRTEHFQVVHCHGAPGQPDRGTCCSSRVQCAGGDHGAFSDLPPGLPGPHPRAA